MVQGAIGKVSGVAVGVGGDGVPGFVEEEGEEDVHAAGVGEVGVVDGVAGYAGCFAAGAGGDCRCLRMEVGVVWWHFDFLLWLQLWFA